MSDSNDSDKYYIGTLLTILAFAAIMFVASLKFIAFKAFIFLVLVAILWPVVEWIAKIFQGATNENDC